MSFRIRGLSSDSIVLLGLLGISLALNVYLAQALYLGRGRARLGPPGFKKGEQLGTLIVRDRTGQQQALAFTDSQQTVLYVFRPTCSWCKRNSSAVRELYAQASWRYRFIALSLEESGLQEFLRDSDAPFSSYSLVPGGSQGSRFVSVPETFVLSQGGTIAEMWTGAYTGETKARIEAYFGASLRSGPILE